MAMVIDKELVAEGRLQRYGTQFKAVDGGMAMYAVEVRAVGCAAGEVFLAPMDLRSAPLGDVSTEASN